ncbi:MAG: hypothetical protein IRZ16_21095, partial [Myxococcaceae bacterium]|nr:hypothetical protein [Myxococcaceae bacterium]
MRAAKWLAVCLCVVPLSAHGEDDATDVAREDAAPPAEAPQIHLSGRVFARAEADERADYRRNLSVPSARLQVKASFEFAQAVIEADIASASLIKDAYVRLADKEHGLRLYAGQFKAPFLRRKLLSTWDLPFVERGLVSDYLTDTHALGGRRIGVMGEVRHAPWLGVKVQLGVFEGAKDALGERLDEDLAARASFEPWTDRLEIGVNGYWAQVNAAGRFERWAAGGDATFTYGGLQLSAEGLFGRVVGGHFTAQIV